jgi:CBS domain-containing protein
MAIIDPFGTNNSTSTATAQSPAAEKTRAKDIAQYGVATIDKNASVYQAVALMVKKHVTGLPVVDDSGLLGIISEKDALKLLYDTEYVAGCVADYMTANVLTFDEEDDLKRICQCLIENNFRRVPILHQGKLAAVITRADLIRANKDKFRPFCSDDNPPPSCHITLAKDIMISGLLTVQKSTPIYEAMDILATKNVTGLPVVDDFMNLVGVVSEKDVLKLLYNPNAKPGIVRDFMTSSVVAFDKNTSLFEICDCLINNNFRRVPILDNGRLVGIISRTDIMAHIMKDRARFFAQKSKI